MKDSHRDTKEVLAIYVNQKFIQYLAKSEARLITQICKDAKGIVGVELVNIPERVYKSHFNK